MALPQLLTELVYIDFSLILQTLTTGFLFFEGGEDRRRLTMEKSSFTLTGISLTPKKA